MDVLLDFNAEPVGSGHYSSPYDCDSVGITTWVSLWNLGCAYPFFVDWLVGQTLWDKLRFVHLGLSGGHSV